MLRWWCAHLWTSLLISAALCWHLSWRILGSLCRSGADPPFSGGASETVRIRVSVYEVYHGLPILPWRTAGNRLSLRLQQAERSLGMPCELAAEAQIKPTEPCWCFIAFCDELQWWVKRSSFHLPVLKFFCLSFSLPSLFPVVVSCLLSMAKLFLFPNQPFPVFSFLSCFPFPTWQLVFPDDWFLSQIVMQMASSAVFSSRASIWTSDIALGLPWALWVELQINLTRNKMLSMQWCSGQNCWCCFQIVVFPGCLPFLAGLKDCCGDTLSGGTVGKTKTERRVGEASFSLSCSEKSVVQ